MLKRSFLLAWLAVSACGGCAARSGVADLVIVDARVWTGAGGEAAAVAVRGERIVAVGSDWQVRRWIGDATEVVEAGGRRVIPGITDSHVHMVDGGLQLGRLNLRDVMSREEFVEKVAAAVQATRDESRGSDRWMLGGRWSVESWDAPSPPRKEWIDPVTPDTPVFLSRMDGHQGLANSVALRMAGIDREGPADPAGGVIERDANTGEPTGILKDSAMDLVTDLVPPPLEDDLYAALLLAMAHGNSLGITSMHDVSGREDLAAMFRAHREGALTVRIRKFLSVPNWIAVIDVVKGFEVNDAWLCVGGFKGYMDGSLGSRTAYMYRPYADSGTSDDYPSGILSKMASPPKELRYMIEQADAAGLQCAVHAIGDEATHILLNAYAAVARKNGPRDRRHRIEHAQHVLPEDIPRFAELGVVASMQPLHKADDGRYAQGALGKGRLAGSYAFRSLMDSGALVAFGSDWPVVSCDPFKGMAAAVTAQTLDGKIWIREESITIEEALRAYTVNPAMAGHGESQLGTIEVGKLADMVILSQDILHADPESIADTEAVMTIVGGKIVFDRLRVDEPDAGPKN